MLGSREEFETRVVPLVEVDGEIVSSTRVRSLVAAGEVEAASREPLAVEAALAFLPERTLDAADAERVAHGATVKAAGEADGPLRLTHQGRLLAVARRRDAVLRPEVVLA